MAAVLGAALRAEGATVAVDGTTVEARTPDGGETTYSVTREIGEPVVVVVAADGDPLGSGEGRTVLDIEDLYDRVAAGIDRAEVRRACRDHLGLTVGGEDSTTTTVERGDGENRHGADGDERDGETLPERGADARPAGLRGWVPSVDALQSANTAVPSVRAVVPVALGAAAIVVLASLVVGTGLAVGPFAPGSGGESGAATAGPTADEQTEELPSYALVGGGGKYPPGVGPTGLANPTALAQAHRAAVANASYELTYTYREQRSDGSQATREVTVWVAAEDTFRTAVSTDGEFRDSAPSFVDRPRYANGSHVFEQRGAPGERWYRTYPVRPSGGADDYADDARRYLGWFLTVEESSVVERFEREGTTYFRVDLRGDPWPGIDDVSGTAVVDEHGVVHSIRRQYTDDGDGSSVTVTMTYTAFGTATVDPPPWLDEAVAATRDGGTAGTTPGTETGEADTGTDQQGSTTPTAGG